MITSWKISCPFCNKSTKLVFLKTLETTEKDFEIAKAKPETLNWQELSSEQLTGVYVTFTSINSNLPSSVVHIASAVSRIEPHKTGLFKGNCSMSDKIFKVYYYFVVDHTKQIAQFTFRIAEEIHDFST